jgi:hypothetical protein
MASVHSLDGLMKWAYREEWHDAFGEMLERHLGPACRKFDIEIGALPDVIGADGFATLWACVFEDFLASDLDDGRNIVEDYLKRRGWKESVPNKAYMAALRSSAMSLYEISGIVPDESLLARDLVRGGDPVRVSERLGTRSLKPWDRIAARIVSSGTRTEMAGGTLLFDHDTSEEVRKALLRAHRMGLREARELAAPLGSDDAYALVAEMFSKTEMLRVSAFLFTNFWLGELLGRILHPTLPQMCNTDGEELVFTTLSYPLQAAATAAAIAESLAAIPALRQDGETTWHWIAPQKGARPNPESGGHTFITTLEDGSLSLGTLQLQNRMLVLETNSRQRAKKGRALLEPALGKLLGAPRTEAHTVEQLMAARTRSKPKKSLSGVSPDEERAIIHAQLERHYTCVLDQPIAILGNITPLEAAKTIAGRRKLVDWLKRMENQAARQNAENAMADYDFDWIWKKLGIAELRR